MKVKILLFLLLLLVGGVIYFGFFYNVEEEQKKEPEIIMEIKDFGYVLTEKDSDFYKEKFIELKAIIDEEMIDEEKFAEKIGELFIIDVFTLDNKLTKNDIGGIQFIHSAAKENYILKLTDTLYKYIESNLDGDRQQELPIVNYMNIIETNHIIFVLNGEEIPGFEVILEWGYEKELGYQTEGIIKLIRENDKFVVVEFN